MKNALAEHVNSHSSRASLHTIIVGDGILLSV